MCDTCGCSSDHDSFTLLKPTEKDHTHDHAHHSHGHHHPHEHRKRTQSSKTIVLETDVLAQNNLLAERNRGYFEAKNITAINLVSSPGSGKTTLLEKLIPTLKERTQVYVIEGDQQTSNDAQRIEQAGACAIQINTGNGCHLDAHMINHAVKELAVEDNALLFIENVGNLVCPALFDLGEAQRIVIASTTEGEDKPLKYPNMFQSTQVCILNKTDLLPYLDFDTDTFQNNFHKVNPKATLLKVSAKDQTGFKAVLDLF